MSECQASKCTRRATMTTNGLHLCAVCDAAVQMFGRGTAEGWTAEEFAGRFGAKLAELAEAGVDVAPRSKGG